MEAERWMIADDRDAEWALTKIRERNAERDRIVSTCQAMAREYEAKARDEQEKAQMANSYLEFALREYFGKVPHKATKTQESYRLPGGTLKLKQQAPELKRDDTALMEAYPEFVLTTRRLQWAELKKRLEITGEAAIDRETGEIIGAITVIPREPEFIVEVK